MTIPIASESLLATASKRTDDAINAAQPTDTGFGRKFEDGDMSPVSTVSVHTHIPAKSVEALINHQTGSAITLLNNGTKIVAVANGLVVQCLLFGWLIRDEQLKVEAAEAAAFDPPAICSNTQTELAKFRFCPDCGITRALHSEES